MATITTKGSKGRARRDLAAIRLRLARVNQRTRDDVALGLYLKGVALKVIAMDLGYSEPSTARAGAASAALRKLKAGK